MGYTRFSGEDFSSRFGRPERAVDTAAPRFGRQKRRIVHETSLSLVLIFSKILSESFA
jgi:hypothetical protein